MLIAINFKNYLNSKESLQLSKLVQKYLPNAIICPSVTDMDDVAKNKKLRVFSQHADSFSGKRNTGLIVPENLKRKNIKGTLLNHSEHRLEIKTIKKTVNLCNELNLKVMLCCESVAEARKFRPLKPWAIAFEDPVLIGSGKPVTNYNPEEISRFVDIFKKSPVHAFCGAGINSVEDIKAAKELGCDGVLISSAIAKDLEKGEKLLKEISKIIARDLNN